MQHLRYFFQVRFFYYCEGGRGPLVEEKQRGGIQRFGVRAMKMQFDTPTNKVCTIQ